MLPPAVVAKDAALLPCHPAKAAEDTIANAQAMLDSAKRSAVGHQRAVATQVPWPPTAF